MLAPSPSQPAKPIPYGHVSLWDMTINFHVHAWLEFITYIAHVHKNTTDAQVRDRALTERDREDLTRRLNPFLDLSSKYGFERTKSRLLRMLEGVESETLTAGRLHVETSTLHQALEDDLSEHHFYHFPKARAKMVQNVNSDWPYTLAAFHSSRSDIDCATNCYAMDQSRACIYHCMMVLESGMPALADRLGVKFNKSKPTWRDMTDDIRAKINERRSAIGAPPKGSPQRSKRQNAQEEALLDACGRAASEFKFFEHAWRNHIAHNRGDYDDNDAKKVLDHTRDFMETLARDLNLKERLRAKKRP